MMRSLFAGVSGLKSHQTRMDVIGNNISNINTTGFKSSRVTFSDMLSQTTSGASAPSSSTGGVNPKQIGLGSAVASVDLVFTDGSAQATGKNTDIALSGNGLFVLTKGTDTFYSRDGAFEFDTNGNYVLPGSGYYVQGWNGINGTINTDGATENIVVKTGKTMEGTATTNVDYSGNLNSAAPSITGISYTSGGSSADPSAVTTYKTVDNITVIGAYNYTYDDRVMTSAQITAEMTTTVENDDGTTTQQIVSQTFTSGNTEDETTAAIFANGVVRANSGTRSKMTLEGDNAGEWTIKNIRYQVSRTVTTREDDTAVMLTLSNGRTIPVAEFEAGASYTIGDTLSTLDGIYDAETMSGFSTATVTRVTVTDASGNNTTYPTTISTSAGSTVKVGYTDGTTESMSSGSYSTGQDIFNSVNVDGTNVIAATLTLSDGTTQKVTSGYYERNHSIPISTVITVYDSIGNSHAVSVLIDKDNSSTDMNMTGDALNLARIVDEDGTVINYTSLTQDINAAGQTVYNYVRLDGESGTATTDQVTWDNRWRAYVAPSVGESGAATSFTQIEDDSSITNIYLNSELDANGNPMGGAISYLYFNEDGSYNSAANNNTSLYAVYSNGNGATPTSANIGFTDATQYSGSTTIYGTTDGNAYGVLQSIQIDNAGVITGSYTNGLIRNEAQIAIAQFVNTSGLSKVGTSLYKETSNSGSANIKTVEAFGLEITPSALEMSNVELASELADMIITQRGFQSNSKIMTVADEMLETIINMKR